MTGQRVLAAFVALCVAGGGSASTSGASPANAGAAAPTAEDTATSQFTVGGLRVILRHNAASDVVAANLYLLGGTQQLTPETQGIETLLLAASERGTASYSRDALRLAMNRLGSAITIDPEDDWTVFGLRSLRSAFDSSWSVFADRVMHPTLASSDVALIRDQMLAAARQRRLQPDAELRVVADSMLYAGHPYALTTTGTERSLASITRDELVQYHASSVVQSRMLLVVVGAVDRATLESLVRSTLARLPVGAYRWTPPPPVHVAQRGLVVEQAALPTNYIIGYYAGPPASSADYNALRIATAVLGGRFFSEIRSQRNLSYAVEAPFVERALSTGGVYVTTVDPEQTLRLMRSEIDELQRERVDASGLRRLVQQFITDYFLKNETNADQASFLARAALYEGDYRAADRFVDALRRITPEDIRRVARDYMKNFKFVYIGDRSRVPRSVIETF